jgi:hypothetical protein
MWLNFRLAALVRLIVAVIFVSVCGGGVGMPAGLPES